MTNPFGKEPPPTVVVKHERPPGLLDYVCACGCGIPALMLVIGFLFNACTAPFTG